MKVYQVKSRHSDCIIGVYESYDLADFHCTSKLYDITPIEVITKSDLIQVVCDLKGAVQE